MPVYLDYAAGGPLHPAAREAMRPWLEGRFGNPSGSHQVARAARQALEEAREELARLLGVDSAEVVFTSGGTEADNLAVLGSLAARPGAVVISAVEHPAVSEAAFASGEQVRVAPVGPDGVVELERLADLLDPGVSLVSIQAANHETGVLQPLGEIARLVRRKAPEALLHTDAVQAAAWTDLADFAACADLVSVSAHKWGGPQGAGALGVRGGVKLRPVLHGGGQERERRSGTHNVAAVAGFAAGAAASAAAREEVCVRVAALRDELAGRILEEVPEARHTAALAPRLPGHLHMRFPGLESEALLVLLDEAGVCASAGAACASGALEPSPVLLAMGVGKQEALSSLRLSLGPATERAEVMIAARAVSVAVSRLRGS